MAWPPTLTELKADMGINPADVRDDTQLATVLASAVVVVERLREGDFAFVVDPEATLPAPGADVELGTLRLAARWHRRRQSPDALVAMADLGTSVVPTFDPDIEMLLQIGRHRLPTIA